MYKLISITFFVAFMIIMSYTNCKFSKNVDQKTYDISFKDSINCIPSSDTAIKIAKRELFNTYGESIFEKEPFTAELEDNKVWLVSGTAKVIKDKKTNLIISHQGVPYIRLSAKDCKVLQVGHTK
jgi:NTF2 fold immunity protein